MTSRVLAFLAAALLLALPGGARAQAADRTPVAAADIARGAVLTAADIAFVPAEKAKGSPGSAAVKPGWVTRRVIAKGDVLREPAVAPPVVIGAGDEVDAVWRSGGVEVRVRGVATGPAAEGERVTLRVGARRRLEGVAVGAGVVRLN